MNLMNDAISTHVYTLFFFLTIMIFNLYCVLSIKDFIKLAKRLKFMTPIYHLSNAIVIYTGMIVSAYTHDMSYTVILMIPVAIFLLVIEIKRYKKMRVIKSDDMVLQKAFYIYAKKIYIIEISVLISMYIIAKIF